MGIVLVIQVRAGGFMLQSFNIHSKVSFKLICWLEPHNEFKVARSPQRLFTSFVLTNCELVATLMTWFVCEAHIFKQFSKVTVYPEHKLIVNVLGLFSAICR